MSYISTTGIAVFSTIVQSLKEKGLTRDIFVSEPNENERLVTTESVKATIKFKTERYNYY